MLCIYASNASKTQPNNRHGKLMPGVVPSHKKKQGSADSRAPHSQLCCAILQPTTMKKASSGEDSDEGEKEWKGEKPPPKGNDAPSLSTNKKKKRSKKPKKMTPSAPKSVTTSARSGSKRDSSLKNRAQNQSSSSGEKGAVAHGATAVTTAAAAQHVTSSGSAITKYKNTRGQQGDPPQIRSAPARSASPVSGTPMSKYLNARGVREDRQVQQQETNATVTQPSPSASKATAVEKYRSARSLQQDQEQDIKPAGASQSSSYSRVEVPIEDRPTDEEATDHPAPKAEEENVGQQQENVASAADVPEQRDDTLMVEAQLVQEEDTSPSSKDVYVAEAVGSGIIVNQCCVILFAVGLFAVIGAIVGGLCATGKCSSGSGSAPASAPAPAPASDTSPEAPQATESPSAPPTMAPTFTPETAAIVDFINSVTFSTVPLLSSPVPSEKATPEEQALLWLIHEDPLDLSAETDKIKLTERYALAAFFFSTLGDFWLFNDDWLVGPDECQWYGITCSYPADGSITVSGIKLDTNNLRGTISVDLGLLRNLSKLELSTNPNLGGSLPTTLGNLKGLHSLNVGSCDLTGTFPGVFGQWSALNGINIGNNGFHGTLPDTIGAWTALTVRIAGCLSEACLLGYRDHAALTHFFLLVAIYRNLQSFLAPGTNFTGTLPSTIGNWNSLYTFSIESSGFSGPLPDSIQNWTELNVFWATSNGLSSSLPEAIGNWRAITSAMISDNAFTGTFPASLANWYQIDVFDISNNAFTGTLPASLGNWSNSITVFDVSNNTFSGTIPESLVLWWGPSYASFDSRHADLRFNNFTGTFARDFCNSTQYKYSNTPIAQFVDCEKVDCCCCCGICGQLFSLFWEKLYSYIYL